MGIVLVAAATLILVSAVLVLVFGPTLRTITEIALLTGVLAPFIVTRIPSLYLRFMRARHWVLNTSATWDLSIRYRTSEATDATALANRLATWTAASCKIVTSSPSKAIARVLERFVVEIHVPEIPTDLSAEDRFEVNVSILPVNVGYRDAGHFLDRDLLPLLGKLNEQIHPEWVTHSLRVQLPHENPYFGLFVQQLHLGAVEDFRLRLVFPSHAGTSDVLVSKDRLTVTAPSIESLRTASTSALAFRVPEGIHG